MQEKNYQLERLKGVLASKGYTSERNEEKLYYILNYEHTDGENDIHWDLTIFDGTKKYHLPVCNIDVINNPNDFVSKLEYLIRKRNHSKSKYCVIWGLLDHFFIYPDNRGKFEKYFPTEIELRKRITEESKY